MLNRDLLELTGTRESRPAPPQRPQLVVVLRAVRVHHVVDGLARRLPPRARAAPRSRPRPRGGAVTWCASALIRCWQQRWISRRAPGVVGALEHQGARPSRATDRGPASNGRQGRGSSARSAARKVSRQSSRRRRARKRPPRRPCRSRPRSRANLMSAPSTLPSAGGPAPPSAAPTRARHAGEGRAAMRCSRPRASGGVSSVRHAGGRGADADARVSRATASRPPCDRLPRQRRREPVGRDSRATAGRARPDRGRSPTCAATADRPRCAKSANGPMPHRPSRTPRASAGTSPPSAETCPTPVIAMASATPPLVRPPSPRR
jgi:hypothetical protein